MRPRDDNEPRRRSQPASHIKQEPEVAPFTTDRTECGFGARGDAILVNGWGILRPDHRNDVLGGQFEQIGIEPLFVSRENGKLINAAQAVS